MYSKKTDMNTAQGRAWFVALDAASLQHAAEEGLYERLADRAPHVSSKELAVLEKDIGRTFPERHEFQTTAARNALRRVLGAYALRNTYCQGMSYIAALMLQHMPEREAFWALAALIESFLRAESHRLEVLHQRPLRTLRCTHRLD